MSILKTYQTRGGATVTVATQEITYENACDGLIAALDARRGVLFSSGMEAPGRYTRWDMGFVDPPLVLTSVDRGLRLEALNARGRALLPALEKHLRNCPEVVDLVASDTVVSALVTTSTRRFPEEERSRQPSVFSVLRYLRDLLGSDEDRHLGLYGAFAYDLAYQFEPIERRIPRAPDQRDLVLYLPDELIIVDHARRSSERRRYDIALDGASTAGIARGEVADPYRPDGGSDASGSDHAPGDYAATVRLAKESFARGDLFEVVPGQTFRAPCADPPSVVFRRLVAANPAPYGGLLNLGDGEFLVAASPEMFVRVRGSRVETCPISGTIARGRDAFEDADQIRLLLASSKDEAELTMCTDVDRNDKARICEPGSVRVIARRQIETYSRLFHTVDHVEGLLRPEMDALDAFLSHAWAVTVTGAPKAWAMDFIERTERSARRWYGGAIGRITFDGNMDTGITIRTVRLKDGAAEVRAGATLLHDSDPEAEDAECALKASAMLASVAGAAQKPRGAADTRVPGDLRTGIGRRVILVDFEDSFVHNLADYLRQTGARVSTYRHGEALDEIVRDRPDLVVLSPGPGRPGEFGMSAIVGAVREMGLPIFGVCLGLQGLAEHFGGALGQLAVPVHGKGSEIALGESRFFAGLPERFTVGRYHSLYADDAVLPEGLVAVARTEDGVIMAIEHREEPIAAVQFHPESILSARGGLGLELIATVLGRLLGGPLSPAAEAGFPAAGTAPAAPGPRPEPAAAGA